MTQPIDTPAMQPSWSEAGFSDASQALDYVATSQSQRIVLIGPACGLLASSLASVGHRALALCVDTPLAHNARLRTQKEGWNGQILLADALQDTLWERQAQEILGGRPQAVWILHELERSPWPEELLKRLRFEFGDTVDFRVFVGRSAIRRRDWAALVSAAGWRSVETRRFGGTLLLSGTPKSP